MAWYDALTGLFRTRDIEPGPQAPSPGQSRRASGSPLQLTRGYDAISNVAAYLSLEKARRSSYGDYDLMDSEAPECKRALDSFVDTALQDGGTGDPLTFVFKDPGVEAVITSLNRRTRIDKRAWGHLRNIRKYGDHFAELVFDRQGVLVAVKDLPVRDIQKDLDQYGLPNEEYPWKQVQDIAGSINDGSTVAKFREWQVIHGGDVPAGRTYAYTRSQLAGARRPWRAVELASNAMLAERIMHTGTRLAFQINVSGLSGDEALQYMREVKRDYERNTFQSTNGGRSDPFGPDTPLDDIWLPWSKDGPDKPVEVLRFGAEIGEIADVKFHYSRYLSALEVPRYELGLDEDIRSKAATNVIDAGYIRRIVRARTVYLEGLVDIYNRALFAAGYETALMGDYRDLYEVGFVPLQLIDEKLRWEIAKIRAEVAKIYSFDLAVVTPEFVLTHFLGLSESDAVDLLRGEQPPQSVGNTPEQDAALNQMGGGDSMSRLIRLLGEDKASEVLNTFNDLRHAVTSDRMGAVSPTTTINGFDHAASK